MSTVRCKVCERFIDTDYDTEYNFDDDICFDCEDDIEADADYEMLGGDAVFLENVGNK